MHRDTKTPPPVTHEVNPPVPPRPAAPIHVTPRRRGGTHWVAWLVFLAVLGVGGYFGYRAWAARQAAGVHARGPTSRPAPPVVAAVAKRGSLDLWLEENGTVTPLNTVTVRSRVDGQIMKLGFAEGQLVKEGDVIAEIDPRPFEVQLVQAQAQLARDQATLANAQADLKRYQDAADTVTQQQIDTQAAVVRQDQAVIKTDEALIDNAKLQLAYCHITAPITGRIGLRQVDLGNIIHASDANGLAVITQIQPISVIFSIPENEIARVVRAASAGGGKLRVDVFDEDNTTNVASGTLTAINNQVDPTSGTVKLKAEFPNEDGALFPNEFVRAHLLVETVRDAVIIPTAGRQLGPPPNDTFAYVVKPDGTVDLRKIKVGPTQEDPVTKEERTVVLDGLQPGEVVVTDGVDKLVPGAKVVVRMEGEGATTRPAGGAGHRGGRGGHAVPAGAATRPAGHRGDNGGSGGTGGDRPTRGGGGSGGAAE